MRWDLETEMRVSPMSRVSDVTLAVMCLSSWLMRTLSDRKIELT